MTSQPEPRTKSAYDNHANVKPHDWVSKSGRPWSLRVKSDLCATCGCTPDCPAHNKRQG